MANSLRVMGDTTIIDSVELEALRVLAGRYLTSSSGHDACLAPGPQVGDAGGDGPDDLDPIPVCDTPLTWQETNAIEALVLAGGAVVPSDRLVRHVRTTGIHAEQDQWVRDPRSQATRIKQKTRARFGCDCVESVWPTRVNRKGHVVRDQSAGLLGYRWIGPDIIDMLAGGL